MTAFNSKIGVAQSVADLLRPVPPLDSFEFMTKKLRTPPGKPFNAHDYPWVKGICQAYDMPEVRQITLQMAARLGKSMTAQGLMVASVEHSPDVGMISMSTKQLLEETVEDKYYRIFENTNATRHLIPPPHDRNKRQVDLSLCKIYGAWSGSTTTLADKPPKYKHAGEVDKWDTAESREADPYDLFMERGIEIPSRKSIVESTPDRKSTSRIYRELLSGWNCRFLIPCQQCGHHIQLLPGDGKTGGIKFDRLANGKVDPRKAYDTARYQCQLCAGEWGDMYRRPAILKGVWCPEGCTVNRDGEVQGKMVGDPENASFQLSRLYAPTFSFADVARQIAKCVVNNDLWQTTRNSWFGTVHIDRIAHMTWEKTGERLTQDYELKQVPAGACFLTMGVDVQKDHFVYQIDAWAKGGASWTVDYGTCWTKKELKAIWETKFDCLDGGPKMGIGLGLMDSGEGQRQDEIINICQELNKEKGPWFWPCKGSKSGLPSGKAYKKQKFEDMRDTRKKHTRLHNLTGFFHVTVNTPWTQTWVTKALFFKNPGEPGSIAIPKDAADDEDYLTQLINEKRDGVDTVSGHTTPRWVVVDTTHPWDFRDAKRYSRAAAEIYTLGAWLRLPAVRKAAQFEKPKSPKAKKNVRRSADANKPKKSKGFVRGSVSDKFIRSS